MDDPKRKLEQLIEFAIEFDTFGVLEKSLTLNSVAIGTLRKDISIAKDLNSISEATSDGLGSLALSRILIEDYLHLLFLSKTENLEEQIENFNAHPRISHYISLQAMQEYGFDFLETKESKVLMDQVIAGFAESKHRFLRRAESDTFNPDDYYRTWTKLSLDSLIQSTGLTDTDQGNKRLKFIVETYDTASSVIHHDSFIIWLAATQGIAILGDEYPELALTIAATVFSQMLKLVMETTNSANEDKQLLTQQINILADILEGV